MSIRFFSGHVKQTMPKVDTIEKLIDKAVLVLLAIYVLFFCWVGYIRYHAFDFYDQDLAIYVQAVWNFEHGSMFSSVLSVPLFANHVEPILFFILPFYFFIQTPFLFLFIQTFAVAFTGYLLYRFALTELSKPWAFLLFIGFLAYPPNTFSHYYEFHPIAIAMVFLVLSFWAYRDQRFGLFLFWSAGAILCREDMPLVLAMFGVLAFFERRPLKWIVWPLGIGVFLFSFFIFYLKPYFTQGLMDFFLRYRHLGETPRDVFMNIFLFPKKTLSEIIAFKNMPFIYYFVSSLGFLPLLSPKTILPGSIFFMEHFLLPQDSFLRSIGFHYNFSFAPFLFISAIYGLKKVLSLTLIKKGREQKIILLVFLIISFLSVNITTGNPMAKIFQKMRFLASQSKETMINQSYINAIGPDASVVSTFKFLPKLSSRKELYSFHHIYKGAYTLSTKPYPLPTKLDYALIDFGDAFTFGFRRQDSDERLKNFFDSYGWQVVRFSGETVLFKSSEKKDLKRLFEILKDEPVVDYRVEGKINNEVEFLGFSRQDESQKSQEVFFSFYWKCLKSSPLVYNVILVVEDEAGRVVKADKRFICYRLYPTNAWREGEVIRESYRYILPSNLPEGKYVLKMSILDEDKKITQNMVSAHKDIFDANGRFRLAEF